MPPRSPSSRPAPRASITSGLTPTPMTTASASSSRPFLVTTLVTRPSAPSKRSSSSSAWISMPWSVSTSWKYRAASGPKLRLRATGSIITIAHRLPISVRRGGHLGGDVGAADQHDALAGGVRADRVAVAERAQVVDSLQLGARDVEPSDVGAGGQQGLAEADLLLVGQLDGAGLRGRASSPRCGSAPRCPCSSRQSASCRTASSRDSRAPEVALGERRAVIGQVGFAADEQDRAVGAGLAQPAGAVGGGHAAADQQVFDVAVGHRRRRPSCWPRPSRWTRSAA